MARSWSDHQPDLAPLHEEYASQDRNLAWIMLFLLPFALIIPSIIYWDIKQGLIWFLLILPYPLGYFTGLLR